MIVSAVFGVDKKILITKRMKASRPVCGTPGGGVKSGESSQRYTEKYFEDQYKPFVRL